MIANTRCMNFIFMFNIAVGTYQKPTPKFHNKIYVNKFKINYKYLSKRYKCVVIYFLRRWQDEADIPYTVKMIF